MMHVVQKKAGEDDITKIDKIIAEINGMDGYSPDLEQQLVALKVKKINYNSKSKKRKGKNMPKN